ncbi:Uncharacterised protein [Salmonella enterica subsp. indica]|uniref:Uncharacterized protein n=1 Tax=Salmonella enterica subsp. indica TaxID=59207 RepID=A0A379YN53_SALER|nr:Uncharacterised protein [Salmonella enterica subsp. indica]
MLDILTIFIPNPSSVQNSFLSRLSVGQAHRARQAVIIRIYTVRFSIATASVSGI